jgi:hypothetical protein
MPCTRRLCLLIWERSASLLGRRPNFGEQPSLLKKWLSTRSAAQESPKTRPKRYQNVVFGPRIGGTREREGVFQQADLFYDVG